jgi:fatty-acyl-CoA synthase
MIKSMNIGWWVERWSGLHPEKTAIFFEGLRITYSNLHGRANRTACWLQSLGLRKGDRVVVMLKNCPEFIELYLACARLGAIFVPVNFRLTAPELAHIVENAQPRIIVFGSEYRELVYRLYSTHRTRDILFSCLRVDPEADQESNPAIDYLRETRRFDGRAPFPTGSIGPMHPEDPQVIMYTSGTTGPAKGAVLSYRKTFFNCLNADIFFDLSFDDIMLVILPMFHSGGLFIQTSPILYKGGTLVIHSRFDSPLTFGDIGLYRVTKFLGVPTIYRMLIHAMTDGEYDLSSLRISAIGGEMATPELLEQCRKAGFPVRQIMGQTETSILFWASEDAGARKPGTVGRPVFHAEVRIMDRDGHPVETGEVGEIAVRGAIMMTGYWQDPVRTRETIRDGWLYTGDLARMDEDGYFYLVDRIKDMYISGGENVYPAEVEAMLKGHPDVADVAVVGIAHETWGEVGKAFIIPRNGADLSSDQVIEYCRGRLAPYKWPREIVFCKDFPRTPLGKVKKRLLVG